MTFATIVPAFFMREKPTSSSRKPACMKKTSTPASRTHSVSTRAATSLMDGFTGAARSRAGGELDPANPVRSDVTVFRSVRLDFRLEGPSEQEAEGLVKRFKGR